MKGKGLVWLVGLLIIGAGLYIYWSRRQGVVSIQTPKAGGDFSITKNAAGGVQVNAALNITKKKKKKGGKFVNFIKKSIAPVASFASNYIPVVGPVVSKGIDALSSKGTIA